MTDFAARLRRLPADTRAALCFFSRLPIRAEPGGFDLRRSAAAWPVAGLLLALGPAALFWLCGLAGLPVLVAALLAYSALTVVTGGLHEDGLADTADGFGGGRTREAKLAIMRDSRIGAYGVLALGFLVATKVTALAAIGLRPHLAALALLGAAVLSRGAALWHWSTTLPARREGLAWAAGRPDWAALLIGGIFAAVAGLALLGAFGAAALLGILLALVLMRLFSALCVRQIGGHTGDTIGAAQQIAEAAVLIGLSAAWAPLSP